MTDEKIIEIQVYLSELKGLVQGQFSETNTRLTHLSEAIEKMSRKMDKTNEKLDNHLENRTLHNCPIHAKEISDCHQAIRNFEARLTSFDNSLEENGRLTQDLKRTEHEMRAQVQGVRFFVGGIVSLFGFLLLLVRLYDYMFQSTPQ